MAWTQNRMDNSLREESEVSWAPLVGPGLSTFPGTLLEAAAVLPAAVRWEARGDASVHWRKIHRSLRRLEKWAEKKRNRMKLNRKQCISTGERTTQGRVQQLQRREVGLKPSPG